MTYSEKLLDRRWQKKRLEVLEAAGFKCELCSVDCGIDESDTSPLHVHHGYYSKNKEPWEYDLDSLFCLCKNCHERATEDQAKLKSACGRVHPYFICIIISLAEAFIKAGRPVGQIERRHEKVINKVVLALAEVLHPSFHDSK